MKDKKYLNGLSIKEKSFSNGSSILNVWIKKEQLIEELNKYEKNGSVNVCISKRKKPSEKGVTHYTYLDEYEPKQEPVHYEEANIDDLF
tara:strand:+ start:16085 stop:16351 length:267 start_codon:yes stop_codon:yes gene_type:complete